MKIIDFYCKDTKNIDGLTLKDMLNMHDQELEKSHTVIQWMFPLNESSAHSKTAPILTQQDIEDLVAHPLFVTNFDNVAEKFLSFLKENGAAHPSWIRPKNHNYLRISRAIKCSMILKQKLWACKFYEFAMDKYGQFPETIGATTLSFWDAALNTQSPQ